MGVILDSSILVKAERQGSNARQLLTDLSSRLGNTEIAISVITLLELSHGAQRADTAHRKLKRHQYIDELLLALPIYPITSATALRAGQIDGESQARGIKVPLADLLIGVTALELGYSVVTLNLRHFQFIPGLSFASL
jgi:tRNA(fMet)-specific endonuclease VapC